MYRTYYFVQGTSQDRLGTGVKICARTRRWSTMSSCTGHVQHCCSNENSVGLGRCTPPSCGCVGGCGVLRDVRITTWVTTWTQTTLPSFFLVLLFFQDYRRPMFCSRLVPVHTAVQQYHLYLVYLPLYGVSNLVQTMMKCTRCLLFSAAPLPKQLVLSKKKSKKYYGVCKGTNAHA